MSIIANWTTISNKGITVSNVTDYFQCPTRSFILSNSSAIISGSYEDNQLVQLQDVLSDSQLIEYFGYSEETDNQYETYEQASISGITGYLYIIDGVYYDLTSSIAKNGTYITHIGINGYPYFEDYTFIVIDN